MRPSPVSMGVNIMVKSTSKKWLRPMDNSDKVIYAALLLWIIPFFFRHIFKVFMTSIPLQPIEFIGLILTVLMTFIVGLRGFRINGLQGKFKEYIAIGTILSLLALGINLSIILWVPRTLNKLKIKDDRLKKFEVMLETANLDNEQKAIISSFIASEKYQQCGELVDVYDRHGSISKYIPTVADKDIREKRLWVERQMVSLKRSTFIFIFVLLISILIGTLSPVKRKEVRAN